jgi:drug/metabolite transporter (DMT)-like permease
VLTLALGAVVVSAAPILVKALSQQGLGPTVIAMWRCLLGALFVGTLARLLRIGLTVPRTVMGLLVLAGLAFALDLWVWHRSIVLAGAGMATILASTQVFLTAILSALFFRESLTARFLITATGAMIGVTLLVGVGSDVRFTPDYLYGIRYGLATFLFSSVFLVTLRTAGRRSRDLSGLVTLTWFSLYAAVFLLGTVAMETEPALPRGWVAWLLVVTLALFAQSLGWWTISRSLPRVEGAVGGLVLLLQPALATIWGALLFGETLLPLQILGVLITLGAVYLGSMKA